MKLWAAVATTILYMALSGCGGGGGGGSEKANESPSAGSGGDGSSEYSVSLSPGNITFDYSIGGDVPAPQIVQASFNGDGLLIGYAPGVTEPDWLTVRQVDSSDVSSPVDVSLSVFPSSMMTPGVYSTTVRFVTGNVESEEVTYVDLPVSMTISGDLDVSQTEIEFSHVNGADSMPEAQAVDIVGDEIDWQASATEDWVSLDVNSGTTPSSLTISVLPDLITESGEYSARVAVENRSNGETEEINVKLYIEPRLLLVDDNGVALTSFPSAEEASSFPVKVRDNAGAAVPWTAVSNQSWLSVTPTGTTGESLTLSADPTGLAVDQIHYAEVSVTSDDPLTENTETVQVGYYVASADPTATELAIAGLHIASDPIRPLVYVTDGATNLNVYNIYTGSLVASLAAGIELKAMAVSTDGEMLYVVDGGDSTIVPVTLPDLQPGTKWAAENMAHPDSTIEYTRINGSPAILTSSYEVLDGVNGTKVGSLPTRYSSYPGAIAAAGDGNSVFQLEIGLSGNLYLNRYVTSYSTLKDSFTITRTHSLSRLFSNVRDIAVNDDGSTAYVASGGESEFPSFQFSNDELTEAAILPGRAYPIAIELGPLGKIYGGIAAFGIAEADVWSYNPDNSEDQTYLLSGNIRDRQVRISGDGYRLLTLTDAPLLILSETTP